MTRNTLYLSHTHTHIYIDIYIYICTEYCESYRDRWEIVETVARICPRWWKKGREENDDGVWYPQLSSSEGRRMDPGRGLGVRSRRMAWQRDVAKGERGDVEKMEGEKERER